MRKTILLLLALAAGGAFLGMLKLMYDMTGHMARMTERVVLMSEDMGRMRKQMRTLVEQVSGIRTSVGHMVPLAEDVRGLRESVETMADVVRRGGEQMERLDPMDMMRQLVPLREQR